MKFYTSDLHFNHNNIIRLCKRPFDNVFDMNTALIQNWNKKVSKNDEVYILGDLIFGDGYDANNLLSKLNGKKYLIVGNHDKFLNDKAFERNYFEWIKPYAKIKDINKDVILFHYPIYEWDKKFHDSIHLYGHVHNNLMWNEKNAYNVGVDVNNFEPKTLQELIKGE